MFDKQLFIDNIRYLAKVNNLKIGELEDSANVSAGYISRIEKTDTIPSIDFVEKVATKLNVSVDMILTNRFSSISESDLYLSRFFEKLLFDTTKNSIYWEKEEKSVLGCLSYFNKSEKNFTHPLFKESTDAMGITTIYKYTSRFHNPNCVSISNDCFNCSISENAKIYLMATEYDNGEEPVEEFEVYLIENKSKINKLINISIKDNSPLLKNMFALYIAAEESSKHINIPVPAKKLIDSFMNN